MEGCKIAKGISKELSTFLLWNKENKIGFKTECYEGWDCVVEICCKIYAKHKHHLLADLKGVVVNSAEAFTKRTNNIKKHQVLVFDNKTCVF